MSELMLSVVIPAYNEADRIKDTLESLKSYFEIRSDISHEIIFVDDGSRDDTVKILKSYTKDWPQLRVFENGLNKGKGYSVCYGMQQASGLYRLFMDADNSVDISHLDTFIAEIDAGSDVAIGSIRLEKATVAEHSGWHRRILGHLAKMLIGFLSVPGIADTQRGFKLFSGNAAKMIFPKQTIDRFGFDIEILTIAWTNGLKIKELPVAWNNPAGSKVTLWSYVQTLRELGVIVWNRILGRYQADTTTTSSYVYKT